MWDHPSRLKTSEYTQNGQYLENCWFWFRYSIREWNQDSIQCGNTFVHATRGFGLEYLLKQKWYIFHRDHFLWASGWNHTLGVKDIEGFNQENEYYSFQGSWKMFGLLLGKEDIDENVWNKT